VTSAIPTARGSPTRHSPLIGTGLRRTSAPLTLAMRTISSYVTQGIVFHQRSVSHATYCSLSTCTETCTLVNVAGPALAAAVNSLTTAANAGWHPVR
jgi:hypothetical protein